MSTSKYSKRIKKGESQAISSQYYRESKSFNNSREINQDTSPLIVKKKPNHNIEYVQEVSIRYLKPPTPPPPGDIIIKEIEAEAFPAAPPLILRQQPPRPFTPDPFIIRELPPRPPPFKTTQIIQIKRRLPPPPRKVILERLAPLPQKPAPILVERWLPYKKQKRRIVFKKAPEATQQTTKKPKNTIIQWEPPEVTVRQEVKYLGVIAANPEKYIERYGLNNLKSSDDLPRFVKEIPNLKGLNLAADFKDSDLYELYGDLDALKLIDLDKAGLGRYREYLKKRFSHSTPFASPEKQQQPPAISPIFNNLSDIIEKTFLRLTKDLNGKINIVDAERLFFMLNNQLGKTVSNSALTDFFTLLDINWDGNIDLCEFKRAFISTI